MKPWRERIKELRALRDAATPGDYELRCREFSNHAPSEIWTPLGWLDQLPRSYREPSYAFTVEAANSFPAVLDALQTAMEALEEIAEGRGWMKDEEPGEVHAAREAVAKASRILAGEEKA